jgi:hypothetical protein
MSTLIDQVFKSDPLVKLAQKEKPPRQLRSVLGVSRWLEGLISFQWRMTKFLGYQAAHSQL